MSGPGPAARTAGGTAGISTPDRRLRVFVSSTLTELAAERAAVRAAITGLRLTPVMFELGARPYPPRDLYRAYVEQSDVFIGIYGDSYGWVADDLDISGLEDEFDLSAGLPRLLYVRTPAPDRDPRLTALVDRMQRTGGSSTTPYRDPAQLTDLVADDLAVLLTERFSAHPAGTTPSLAPGWLPAAATPLTGRRAELAGLTELLRRAEVHLVTLTGPGGIGKTRLAVAAATAVVGEWDDVWFVDLASLRDSSQVLETLAMTLGIRLEGRRPVLDVIAERIADRRALLLLDNAEQVRAAGQDLALLLARCPRLTLLVTSRSLLGLRGEHDVPLQPLDTPPTGDDEPGTVTAAAAVQLFEARARQADPAFALGDGDMAAVAELVRRLDGLPLAIELAAARVRTLPPRALVRRLRTALDLRGPDGVPDRQRTMRDTLQWSHDLLAADEQALLARLSVFAGGCTLDSAEEVGAADGDIDVLEALSSLVAQSLVFPTDAGEDEPRFRMLRVVRDFAAERLRDRGEEDATRRRLAAHLVALSAAAGAGLGSVDHRLWRARLAAEAEDLQETLRWAVATDQAELVVRLASPLGRWWWARGLLVSMATLSDQTADLPSAAALPPDAAALLLWARGSTRIALGQVEPAVPLLSRLVDDARALGDPWLLGQGLTVLAMTRPPSDPGARAMLEEAVTSFRGCGDLWAVGFALIPLGDLALIAGDVAEATARHAEALRAAREIDDEHLVAALLDQLGLDALIGGDAAAALGHLRAAAALHRELGDEEGVANCLDALAGVALALGLPRLAGRLVGGAAAARQRLGIVVWPLLRPLADQLTAAVDAVLGDAAPAERAAGADLGSWGSLDAGLRELGEHQPAPPQPATPPDIVAPG